jgi:hypothetical protein
MMDAKRVFEILREHGGQIVASQEAYEVIYRELQTGVAPEHVQGVPPVGLEFSTLTMYGVPVYWARYPFPEFVEIERAKAVAMALAKIQEASQ